jgi:hypothetical protein
MAEMNHKDAELKSGTSASSIESTGRFYKHTANIDCHVDRNTGCPSFHKNDVVPMNMGVPMNNSMNMGCRIMCLCISLSLSPDQ